MRAIFYSVNPLGWVACKALRRFWPGCLLTRLNGLSLRTVEPPELPGDDWVRLRTTMAGICGTDLALIAQKQPPDSILQAFSSMPMGLGHESVAVVDELGPAVDAGWLGKRVCVEPTLGCAARGIDPPCPRCQAGDFGACERFADLGAGRAKLPPGTSIGYNARTGGAYGEHFVAHVSQLVALDESIDEERAVLTDPLACSLHAVLKARLDDASRVLVYGAGVLGLGVVAALRAIDYSGRIDALDVHPYLATLAERMCASDFLRLPPQDADRFAEIATRTGGTVQRARFGNYMLSGGYDVVFDCVGSNRATSESLRWTRSRGQVVLVGTGHGRGVDMTPIWFTELDVTGAYGRRMEQWRGRRVSTYNLVQELMLSGDLKTEGLLTHVLPFEQYKQAFRIAMNKGANEAVKVALDFREKH